MKGDLGEVEAHLRLKLQSTALPCHLTQEGVFGHALAILLQVEHQSVAPVHNSCFLLHFQRIPPNIARPH